MACDMTSAIVTASFLTEDQRTHLDTCEDCRKALAARKDAPSLVVTGDVVTAEPDLETKGNKNDIESN